MTYKTDDIHEAQRIARRLSKGGHVVICYWHPILHEYHIRRSEIRYVFDNDECVYNFENQFIDETRKDIACQCPNEVKHGETSVMCCNHCGLPTEEFWTKNISLTGDKI